MPTVPERERLHWRLPDAERPEWLANGNACDRSGTHAVSELCYTGLDSHSGVGLGQPAGAAKPVAAPAPLVSGWGGTGDARTLGVAGVDCAGAGLAGVADGAVVHAATDGSRAVTAVYAGSADGAAAVYAGDAALLSSELGTTGDDAPPVVQVLGI